MERSLGWIIIALIAATAPSYGCGGVSQTDAGSDADVDLDVGDADSDADDVPLFRYYEGATAVEGMIEVTSPPWSGLQVTLSFGEVPSGGEGWTLPFHGPCFAQATLFEGCTDYQGGESCGRCRDGDSCVLDAECKPWCFEVPRLSAGEVTLTGATCGEEILCAHEGEGVYSCSPMPTMTDCPWSPGQVLRIEATGDAFPEFSVEIPVPGALWRDGGADADDWGISWLNGPDMTLTWLTEETGDLIRVIAERCTDTLVCSSDDDGELVLPESELACSPEPGTYRLDIERWSRDDFELDGDARLVVITSSRRGWRICDDCD